MPFRIRELTLPRVACVPRIPHGREFSLGPSAQRPALIITSAFTAPRAGQEARREAAPVIAALDLRSRVQEACKVRYKSVANSGTVAWCATDSESLTRP